MVVERTEDEAGAARWLVAWVSSSSSSNSSSTKAEKDGKRESKRGYSIASRHKHETAEKPEINIGEKISLFWVKRSNTHKGSCVLTWLVLATLS